MNTLRRIAIAVILALIVLTLFTIVFPAVGPIELLLLAILIAGVVALVFRKSNRRNLFLAIGVTIVVPLGAVVGSAIVHDGPEDPNTATAPATAPVCWAPLDQGATPGC